MSISDIKTFLGRQDSVSPDSRLRDQLQQDGIKQAKEFYQNTEFTLSSRYSQAYVALSDSLRKNIQLNEENPPRSQAPQDEQTLDDNQDESSLFDFDSVVNNVFSFVSRVIRGASNSGADDEELESLFAQARDGIGQGISAARQDLSGILDDNLSRGIDKVGENLAERLTDLQQEIFSPLATTATIKGNFSAFSSSELLIRTRDGDDISIFFGRSQNLSTADVVREEQNSESDITTSENSQNPFFSYLEQLGLSITISGNIDEDEFTAISDLVEQLSSVADEFFNGSVFEAFEKALGLGYDEKELIGFSARLTRGETASLTNAYEEVQNIGENTNKNSAEQRIVNQYVDELISSIDQSRELLNSNQDYTNLINGIVNTFDDEVKTPDLLTAINRFHQFNDRIVNNLSA
jgi:hypothetical protein